MAMLREQGELALTRGDRRAAEADWSRMLELVVEPAQRKAKKPAARTRSRRAARAPARGERRPSRQPRPGHGTEPAGRASPSVPRRARRSSRASAASGPVGQAAAPAARRSGTLQGAPEPTRQGAAAARPRRRPAPRSNLPILTLDRFEQAMQIARLAAEHDLPELSCGPSARRSAPARRSCRPIPTQRRRVVRMARRRIDEGPIDPVSPRVVANLVELERLWQKHHVPADRRLPGACATPSCRRAGPPRSSCTPRRSNQQLAAAPAERRRRCWPPAAVRAGKVDDLKQAIASGRARRWPSCPPRSSRPSSRWPPSDTGAAVAALKRIAARLKHDTSRTTAELACHAALPALDRPQPELATAALEVLDACAKGFENSGQPEPLGTLLIMLARRQFQLGDAAGGRKRLEAYLEAMEKNTARLRRRLSALSPQAAARARGRRVRPRRPLARRAGRPGPVRRRAGLLRRRSARRRRPGAAAPPARRQARPRSDTRPCAPGPCPTKDRRVVRILTSHGRPRRGPGRLRTAEAARTGSPPRTGAPRRRPAVVSTATALIDAARQAGTLDQLADEARAAADQTARRSRMPRSSTCLIELARGQGAKVAPRIEARLAELIKENEASQ